MFCIFLHVKDFFVSFGLCFFGGWFVFFFACLVGFRLAFRIWLFI